MSRRASSESSRYTASERAHQTQRLTIDSARLGVESLLEACWLPEPRPTLQLYICYCEPSKTLQAYLFSFSANENVIRGIEIYVDILVTKVIASRGA
jgi:hypothetical protein